MIKNYKKNLKILEINHDYSKKMEDCGITMANSPSKIGKTLLNKLSN